VGPLDPRAQVLKSVVRIPACVALFEHLVPNAVLYSSLETTLQNHKFVRENNSYKKVELARVNNYKPNSYLFLTF